MPRFALDNNGSIVDAAHAKPRRRYRCRECKGILGIRGGHQRQRHFYHRDIARDCRSAGTGAVHLAVQQRLIDLLGEEGVMEKQFPDVRRIADIAWPAQRIIFEVQCASISAEEVAARNADYASQGYTVVWILHEDRYGRRRLSDPERFLQGKTYYYTDIDQWGKGGFYERAALVVDGKIAAACYLYDIELDVPFVEGVSDDAESRSEESSMKNSIAFKNDRTWRIAHGDTVLARRLRRWRIRARWLQIVRPATFVLDRCFIRPYQALFYLALEKATR